MEQYSIKLRNIILRQTVGLIANVKLHFLKTKVKDFFGIDRKKSDWKFYVHWPSDG